MKRWIRPTARGSALPAEEWARRHRYLTTAAVAQAVGLAGVGLLRHGPGAALVVLLIGGLPLLAAHRRWPRRVRAAATMASLSLAAGTLIPLTGSVQAFSWVLAMTAVAALYQDWIAFPVTVVSLLVSRTTRAWWGEEIEGTPHGSVIAAASLAMVCAALLASWRLGETAARLDPLTGLGNRLLLREVAARLLRRRRPFSLIFLEVRDFDLINDTRGQGSGDRLVLELADRLTAGVRSADLVVRLVGHQFAVLVPGSELVGEAVAANLVTVLRTPIELSGRPLTLSLGVGLASSAAGDALDAAELMHCADLALHQSTAEGKNRVVPFRPGMGRQLQDRAELAEDLVTAVAQGGQFVLHYQPVVTMSGGRVVSHEALLRWDHPRRGSIPPLDFVPLAEQTGAIVAIGAWALGRATLDAAAGIGAGDGPGRVAVNVSAVQLADDGFVDAVRGALARSGLPAGHLTLEVTESLLVGDGEVAVSRLQELRAIGVRIAIDDFGTGYSSLSYLRHLPADVIKIDRSFVTDLARGGAATTLVSSIVELARSFGLDVVAEGVETAEQQAELSDLGCHLAQGYLFGRPAPRLVGAEALAPRTAG